MCKINPADPIGTFDATAAWMSLPQVKRDLIGMLAIKFAFAGVVSEDVFADDDRLLSRELNDQGRECESVTMGALIKSVGDALPEAFGANGEDPTWMLEAASSFSALSKDHRTDHEIATAAIRGARGAFAPAALLAEVGR